MKSRETKQRDLTALTEKLQGSKSAMVVSFSKATVNKDQEFRNQIREAGANYQVVKNTLARIAVKGTPFEEASEYFKGVTALAWTDSDPVILSKAISKFIKENAGVYTFKAGIVDGRVVNLAQVQSIASLPSKEELISKLLWVINAQAQRIVTVINAVPRNLAVVIKQIGDAKIEAPVEAKAEETSAPAAEEAAAPAVEQAPAETPAAVVEEASEVPSAESSEAEAAPVQETVPEEKTAQASIEESPESQTDSADAVQAAEPEEVVESPVERAEVSEEAGPDVELEKSE
ncbi:MAG: 50S ribosomal protein L10 [Blastocatellia bacterium]|nr:50S ribosomal protein L10 [Blastocatellia bacterium]MDQ3221210.1 50S ribosomal protein L10 [Acidobacteriota bacterium]